MHPPLATFPRPAASTPQGGGVLRATLPRQRNDLLFTSPAGAVQRYRIRAGNVEFQRSQNADWRQLTSDEVLQHLVLNTVVGNWLRGRMGWAAIYPEPAPADRSR